METNTALALVKQADELMPSVEILEVYKKQADWLVAAKMLPPGYETGSQVMAVALRGRELGVGFWRSVEGMFPYQGRIGYMGAFVHAMIIQRIPKAKITVVEQTADRCTLQATRQEWGEHFEEVTVTLKEASDAGWSSVWKYDDTQKKKVQSRKPTWGDPKMMLYWRALGQIQRMHFSDVFGGPAYTRDELQDIPTDGVPEIPPSEVAASSAPYETAQAKATREEKERADKAKPAGVVAPAPVPEVQAPAAPPLAKGSEIEFDPPPAPPQYNEEGKPIDAQGNLLPNDPALGDGNLTYAEGPTVPNTYKAPILETPPPIAAKSAEVDEVLLEKFRGVAAHAQDRKTLETLWDDYSKDANPNTKTKLYRVKVENVDRINPRPR